MPIRQPVPTIIRADDFHDKAFSFPVESIVGPEWMIGNLVVNAPEGYLLTTSLTTEPKQTQDFPYKKHPNGQWIAEGTVTLLFTGDRPTSGKIVIHNSLDEKIVLTVDTSANTSLTISEKPELTVSDSVLTIMQSSADRPGFGLLTIAQTNANTPVSISTDSPDYFLLASDSRPTFGPSILVVPSATGTYVHIRYFSGKRGRQKGHLRIEAPYTSETVILEGQKMSLLPSLRTGVVGTKPVSDTNTPARKWWITGLTVGLLAALAVVSYTFKCQLFPSLCQDRTASQVTTSDEPPRLKPASTTDTLANSELDKVIRSTISSSVPAPQVEGRPVSQSAIAPVNKVPQQMSTANVVNEPIRVESTKTPPKVKSRQTVDNQVKVPPKRRQDSATADEESELEKALNPPD
ncbi:hypothetical protein [Spirosoma pollinicola]|uniref:Uncharacterized protein n=1 Tax=Spirosoma pollinicola TaxID=2057025 RepID=A0A2K8YY91_9BACT|nr:hypothetical protein [Spirosoma pollinicola]AUD02591.1 hypothetical protein CWM47_12560 [Spirosoma pollinicola]